MLKKFLQSIFSMKNDYYVNRGKVVLKRKVVKILGIKIRFTVSATKNSGNKIVLIRNGKEIRSKNKLKQFDMIKIVGKNNIIKINADINFEKGDKIIKIFGDDNSIDINSRLLGKTKIVMCGDNNRVFFGENSAIRSIELESSGLANNRVLSIGNNTSINSAIMFIWSDDASVKVGDDCMLSWDIQILTDDGHTIVDNKTKECLNPGGNFIEIGNHVWVGHDVNILKNVKIADNSIVGACSVVTKQFDEPNVAIAGNPAKIIKRDIDWDRETA